MDSYRGQVLVVGSLNADLTVRTDRFPGPGETVTGSDLTVSPGGKGGNQAAAAGLLGADVRMLGNVGDDAHGRLLVGRLESARVDVRRVRTMGDAVTGCAVITVDAAGENTIVVAPGANRRLTADDVRSAQDFFTVRPGSVLTLCLEVAIEVVLAAAQAARAAGVRVLLNISPYQQVPPELLAVTDVLVVNAHELADLTGVSQIDPQGDWSAVAVAARTAMGDTCPPQAVVTLGGAGARVLDLVAGAASAAIRPPKIKPVDTTGCGDAFLSSLAFRLAAGDDIDAAAAFATRVGAYAATGRGAQDSYPTAAQLAIWRPEG